MDLVQIAEYVKGKSVNKSKAYVVSSYGGQYDAWESPVAVFETQEAAEAYKKEQEESVPVYSEYLRRLVDRAESFNSLAASKVFHLYSDKWYELWGDLNFKAWEKVHEKYKGQTADLYAEGVYYRVQEVDFHKASE